MLPFFNLHSPREDINQHCAAWMDCSGTGYHCKKKRGGYKGALLYISTKVFWNLIEVFTLDKQHWAEDRWFGKSGCSFHGGVSILAFADVIIMFRSMDFQIVWIHSNDTVAPFLYDMHRHICSSTATVCTSHLFSVSWQNVSNMAVSWKFWLLQNS